MSERESEKYAYWAFISYSHDDERWARWLQRAIESYGIPVRVVGTETPLGEPAPPRLRPVFRDRTDLAASSDLSRELKAALCASRYLIVVCSPSAAASDYVRSEIEEFLALGRRERILSLVVSGEFGVGGEAECLPLPIRDPTPKAADIRPPRGNRREALLGLLAPMLGIGLDALRLRDEERRLRHFQRMTALFILISALLLGITTYAELQRRDAVYARAQAESVLEYVMFDLPTKLAPLGQLDILEDVQARVRQYFTNLGTVLPDSEVRAIRPVVLQQRGGLLMKRGSTREALETYRQALRETFALRRRDSSNVALLEQEFGARLGVAEASLALGDTATSAVERRSALAVAQRMARQFPHSVEIQRHLLDAHGRLGEVLLVTGDVEGAITEDRAALGIADSLEKSDPSSETQLAQAAGHDALALALITAHHPTEARVHARDALALWEHLRLAAPDDTDLQSNISAGLKKVGMACFACGQVQEATTEYLAALAIDEALARSDPHNAERKYELCGCYAGLMQFSEVRGLPEAQVWRSKLRALLEGLERDGVLQHPQRELLKLLRGQHS